MKKIMQINITCGRGSTGKLAQSLYEATKTEGYDVCFAYSAYTPALKEAFSIETTLQNYLRRAKNKFFGRKQRHSNAGTKRLISYIKRERPDLIHIHNVQQNSVNYQRLFEFLKNSDIPVVFTLHDCWPFTGGCFHFTERGCQGYKSGCQDCPMYPHPDDITFTAADAYKKKKELIGKNNNIYMVSVSNWLQKVATDSYMGTMKHKIQTIYNGINTANFSPKESNITNELGMAENCFVILSIASYWNDEKGLPLFLELSRKIPENTVIVLIGDGLEDVGTEYENIICIPKTTEQTELAYFYSAADVFINGSIEETFGLTTAEALACGTPAVVFDSTACPEIVDENTGIVVQRDKDSVLKAIEEIRLRGKDFYKEACIKRARDLFDEDRMIREYLELYRSILDV